LQICCGGGSPDVRNVFKVVVSQLLPTISKPSFLHRGTFGAVPGAIVNLMLPPMRYSCQRQKLSKRMNKLHCNLIKHIRECFRRSTRFLAITDNFKHNVCIPPFGTTTCYVICIGEDTITPTINDSCNHIFITCHRRRKNIVSVSTIFTVTPYTYFGSYRIGNQPITS